MTIRVLPPNVASGIAAGEVVERPASVVKELVENSLDAHATSVTVEVLQGGTQSIRVTDNGHGIPDGELETAFARHATSKLETLGQLEHITTLGFRGEALPSIAAAAHVRMASRTADAGSAAFVEFDGGELVRHGVEASAPGTVVLVEALFSAIPARLKFLRSTSAEAGRIRQVIDHLALANPHVRFMLRSDGRTLLQTPGNGYLRDAVAAVHGAERADSMIEVTASARAPYRAYGLVAPPSVTRPNRAGITLFVNGRWVVSPRLLAAVDEAYTGLVMEGRYPVGIIFLELPPTEVDVNVHPAKREVRFVRDADAFTSVQRAVREALLAASPVAEAHGLLPDPAAGAGSEAGVVAASPAFTFTMPSGSGAWAPMAPQPLDQNNESAVSTTPSQDGPPMPRLRVLGQVANAYIIAEGPDGMYLIDQHAAHESVLFYRLLAQWEEHRPEVQPLLEPMPIELSPEQQERVSEATEGLEGYGFLVELFGEGSLLVRAVPAMSRQAPVGKLIAEVLERRGGDTAPTTPSHWSMAASIACHSAVRAGQALDQQEMAELVRSLETEANPQHCPHGRPTTVKVTTAMLERQFGRT